MEDLNKEKINKSKAIDDEGIEIDSEEVKVVKIPDSKLMKIYYWKKEKTTILAIGRIGIEKRPGDQTKEIQKEYTWPGTDQILKIIAAMIEAKESTKKN